MYGVQSKSPFIIFSLGSAMEFHKLVRNKILEKVEE